MAGTAGNMNINDDGNDEVLAEGIYWSMN